MHWKVRENQMVFLEAKQQQTKARWMVTMVQTGREAAALHSFSHPDILSELQLPYIYINHFIVHFLSIFYKLLYRNGYTLNGHDVLPDIQELPPSRPMTPNEQMDIMRAIEDEVLQATGLPSERDEQVWNTFCNISFFQYLMEPTLILSRIF